MRFRDQPEPERFKQASQTRGRKMKCLQFKSGLGGADEAYDTQTEGRAHRDRRFGRGSSTTSLGVWGQIVLQPSDGDEEGLKRRDVCSEQ